MVPILAVHRVMRMPSFRSPDDLLRSLGLQRRRSAMNYVMPTLGVLGVGAVLGASLGLLFTTRRGAQVRRSVRHAARRAVGRPTPTVAEALDEARDSEYAHADYGVRVGAAKA